MWKKQIILFLIIAWKWFLPNSEFPPRQTITKEEKSEQSYQNAFNHCSRFNFICYYVSSTENGIELSSCSLSLEKRESYTEYPWFRILNCRYFLFCLWIDSYGSRTYQSFLDNGGKPFCTEHDNQKDRKADYNRFLFQSQTSHVWNFRHNISGDVLSIRSLWGVFIVLIIGIIQFFNTKLEEKRLIKTFGEEYRKYIQKVKSKLFIPIYRIYIVIGAIATILGLVQKGIR